MVRNLSCAGLACRSRDMRLLGCHSGAGGHGSRKENLPTYLPVIGGLLLRVFSGSMLDVVDIEEINTYRRLKSHVMVHIVWSLLQLTPGRTLAVKWWLEWTPIVCLRRYVLYVHAMQPSSRRRDAFSGISLSSWNRGLDDPHPEMHPQLSGPGGIEAKKKKSQRKTTKLYDKRPKH